MIVVYYKTRKTSNEREKQFYEISSELMDLYTQPDIIILRVVVNGVGFTPSRFEKHYLSICHKE